MNIEIQRRPINPQLPLMERILACRGLDSAALNFSLTQLADFTKLKGIDQAIK